jgi:hypothetical protein
LERSKSPFGVGKSVARVSLLFMVMIVFGFRSYDTPPPDVDLKDTVHCPAADPKYKGVFARLSEVADLKLSMNLCLLLKILRELEMFEPSP